MLPWFLALHMLLKIASRNALLLQVHILMHTQPPSATRHAAGLLRRSTEQPSSPATRSLLKHDDTKNGLIQSEEKSRSFQCASRISIKSEGSSQPETWEKKLNELAWWFVVLLTIKNTLQKQGYRNYIKRKHPCITDRKIVHFFFNHFKHNSIIKVFILWVKALITIPIRNIFHCQIAFYHANKHQDLHVKINNVTSFIGQNTLTKIVSAILPK